MGNRTECALLMMLRGWGEDYAALRELHHEHMLGKPLSMHLCM